MTIIQRLEATEFPSLCAVDDGFCPDPSSSIAIVAQQNEEIIGRVFLVAPTHLEGPWVMPAHRGHILGRRLIRAAENEARRAGITKLFAYADREEIEDYLSRMGFGKINLTVWRKDL